MQADSIGWKEGMEGKVFLLVSLWWLKVFVTVYGL